MPPKKTTAPGAVLAPLDTNQDRILLREARSQKRKATSPTLQDEELDQEISNLEAIHPQVKTRREKMRWLSELQKKTDEAAEEMRQIAQDNEQGHRPQQRDLRQEGLATMICGMMIFNMTISLLMVLLP
jgi:Cys-tRNA synthase (O-phospho-L-seryl-tRNA:Cys-tRNA synthase)